MKIRWPFKNQTDGMIVTIDDVVDWDGRGEQLGLPSLVGTKRPVEKPGAKPDRLPWLRRKHGPPLSSPPPCPGSKSSGTLRATHAREYAAWR